MIRYSKVPNQLSCDCHTHTLFGLAYLYQERKKNIEKAIELYEAFLQIYPNLHADDLEISDYDLYIGEPSSFNVHQNLARIFYKDFANNQKAIKHYQKAKLLHSFSINSQFEWKDFATLIWKEKNSPSEAVEIIQEGLALLSSKKAQKSFHKDIFNKKIEELKKIMIEIT